MQPAQPSTKTPPIMLSVIQSQRNDFLAVEVLAHSRVRAAHHMVPGYMALHRVG